MTPSPDPPDPPDTAPAADAMSDEAEHRAHRSSRGGWRGTWRTLLTIGLAAVVLWGLLAGISGAGGTDRVRTITSRLKCPVCQGESVAESPSDSAQSITALVKQQVAAGQSDQQIEQFFVQRYGDWILLDPPASGNTLLLWAVPLLAITGGAVALVSRLERSKVRRILVVSATTLGLATTGVLIVVGARDRTPREASALGAAPVVDGSTPAGGTVVNLSAVTDQQMEDQIAKTPYVVGMRLALAQRYLDEGEIDKAFAHTSVAITLPGTDQDYEKSLRLHGWLTALKGAPESGAQYLRAALTLSPDDRDAMYFLAQVELTGLHDPATAGQAVDQLLASELTPTQRSHIEALKAQIDEALKSPGTAPPPPTIAATTGTTIPATAPGTAP
jgi:cytochrome c-type biogenesis protein CcmH